MASRLATLTFSTAPQESVGAGRMGLSFIHCDPAGLVLPVQFGQVCADGTG
jgi:hypothetical protein